MKAPTFSHVVCVTRSSQRINRMIQSAYFLDYVQARASFASAAADTDVDTAVTPAESVSRKALAAVGGSPVLIEDIAPSAAAVEPETVEAVPQTPATLGKKASKKRKAADENTPAPVSQQLKEPAAVTAVDETPVEIAVTPAPKSSKKSKEAKSGGPKSSKKQKQ